MKTILELKVSSKWKAMLVLALLCLTAQGAWAYTVTVSSNNTNYGTVSGGGTYSNGQSCTIRATAKTNCGFYKWVKVSGGTETQLAPNATYTFTVTSNMTIKAYFYPAWNGTQTSGAYMLTHDVTLNHTVYLDGNLALRVNNGGNHNRPVYIRRGNGFYGDFFYVNGTETTDYNLTIIGNITESYYDTIYLDGGAVYNTPGDARSGLVSKSGSGLCVFMNKYAKLEMGTVVMQNFYNNFEESGTNGAGNHYYHRGGAIVTINHDNDGFKIHCPDNTTSFKLAGCVIRGCYGRECGSTLLFEWTKHKAELTNVKFMKNAAGIYDDNGDSGTLRCYGSTNVNLTMTNVEFGYNKTANRGGAINWYAGGGSLAKLTIKGNSKFHHNEASTDGGGLNLGALCDIQKAEIYNNTAGSRGGGICMFTYSGGREYEGYGVKVTVDSNVSIHDNEALGFGGGISILLSTSILDQLGFNSSDNPRTEAETECYVKIMDGGKIFNNKASRGGGVFVEDRLPYRHKNTVSGKLSPVYKRSITIEGGDIYNNYAKNMGSPNYDSYLGGAIYVAKYPYTNNADYLYDYQTYGAGSFTLDVKGGLIHNNVCEGNGYGGAFYLLDQFKENNQYNSTCNINVNNSSGNGTAIYSNHAYLDGGGFYARCATVTVSGGYIGQKLDGTAAGNIANRNGGGFYVNAANNTVLTTIKGGVTMANNTAQNGAGAYVNQGRLVVQDAATNLTSNTASTSGGGIYMAGGTVTFTDATMQDNRANSANGGGLYLGSGTIEVNGTSAAIRGNYAQNHGGGVYIGNGTFEMTGGAIGGTVAEGNTTGSGGYGGGLFMGGGVATLTSGSISGNTATEGYGGGIYMNGGTCTLSGGANIGGESATYANSARLGGGIYSAGGDITVNGGHIDHNNATADGGGIYSNGPEASVLITKEGSNQSFMQYNTAVNGGGIYANRGTVTFDDGNVNYNYASNYGGGMYVNDEGTLYLKGNAVLSRNHVPTGKKGGGVYLRGTVVVGEASKAETSILAEDNFAFTTDTPEAYVCDNTTRNNIYLPEPIANPYTSNIHRDVITVIEDGIGLTSHVGFSVPRNHVPVIYCERSSTSWAYLDRFTTGPEHDLNTRLFDDTEHYLSVHYIGWPEAFDPDHVYLYGFWPEAVRSLDDVPDNGFTVDGNTVTISNKEGLAWLISYVNGLNNSEPHNSADLVVNLEADVDMKDFGWVPIGFRGVSGVTPKPFNGTFNGNGHLIEGVNGMVYGQGENGVVDYGLFGYVTGGTVQDVFVKGMEYYTDNNGNLILGGLIGENTGGMVSNSEVQSKLVSQSAQTLIGGLVGRQTDGTVHSAIGIADMTGGRMGGLVGELAGGDLYNSFANSKFTSKDTNKYSGGLVAVNGGTVENCYARLRGDVPSGNFGILVGDNTDGEVNYCYAPAGMTNYKAAGAAPTGHGNYGDSFLPYLYRHRDTQVSLADSDNNYVPTGDDVDKQMLIALNNWVNEMSTEDMAYTKWGRPWQESNDNKPLNDDYPILKMPLNDAVAAKTGDPYLYYSPIDTLLVKYTAADESIWKYRTTTDTVRGDNRTSASKLYIAEDVALINQNPLNAYVGITLDNSAGVNGANPQGGVASEGMTDATDWHMISSPLTQAPIGINYSTNENQFEFSYGHPDGMPYYRFYPKDDPKHGYFPSHRFGTEYSEADNSATVGGNYYTEWDFYSYDEPQYHWINFKRNSASHWHIDDHTWQITYNNEPSMFPGKGYFAATREETFLQCYGTLNNGSVEFNNLTQTAGVPRHGYNLIGNPYQAYLDFNAFAIANSSTITEDVIWNTPETASYTVIDEDSQDYVTFSYDASNNPAYAGRFIYPHQGFFVLLRDRDNAAATFEPVMRNVTAESVKFRNGERPNYPLVNLYVKESSGNGDRVTVELGRPDNGGAPLMKGLRTGNGKIWCHYNDEDWAIAYTQPGITEVGIRFETAEDMEYTLRWDTQNGEFNYLHLIDNMTGANIDCLSESEYKFSSRTSDYTSRFKLVFGYTGIEENDTEATEASFAFMMGDEMVVNGEGVLQVFDVNGRLVTSRELHGVQSTVMLPNVANGVYVLRLTEGTQSRVQKMVISK